MLEIKCMVNGICWNHPKTITPLHGKSSSMKSIPGAKKSGDPWSRCKMVVACDEGSSGAEGKEQIWRLVDGLDASGKERRVLRVRRGDNRKNRVGAEDRVQPWTRCWDGIQASIKQATYAPGGRQRPQSPAPTPKDFPSSRYGLSSQHWPPFIGELGACRRVLPHITLHAAHACHITAPDLQAHCWGGCEPGGGRKAQAGTFLMMRQAQGRPWEVAGEGGISGGDCQLGPAWKICTNHLLFSSDPWLQRQRCQLKRSTWDSCEVPVIRQRHRNTGVGRIHFHCLPGRDMHALPWGCPGADQRKSAWVAQASAHKCVWLGIDVFIIVLKNYSWPSPLSEDMGVPSPAETSFQPSADLGVRPHSFVAQLCHLLCNLRQVT